MKSENRLKKKKKKNVSESGSSPAASESDSTELTCFHFFLPIMIFISSLVCSTRSYRCD